MNTQPSIMIAVDQAAMQALMEEMKALRRAVESVQMTPKSPWVTLAEYSRQIGKSEKTVRNWVRDGKIESRREGTALMIKAA